MYNGQQTVNNRSTGQRRSKADRRKAETRLVRTRCDGVLGVTGRARSELAEKLELLHGNVVSDEVEHGVVQRNSVSVGEDEAVSVHPLGVGGRVLHHLVVEQVSDGSAAHGRTGMTRLRHLWLVGGDGTHRVDALEFKIIALVVGIHWRRGGHGDGWLGVLLLLGGGRGGLLCRRCECFSVFQLLLFMNPLPK